MTYKEKYSYIKQWITQEGRSIIQNKPYKIIISKDLIQKEIPDSQTGYNEEEKQQYEDYIYLTYTAMQLIDESGQILPIIISEPGIIKLTRADFEEYEDDELSESLITIKYLKHNQEFFILPLLMDDFSKNIKKAIVLLNGSLPIKTTNHLYQTLATIFQGSSDSVYIEILMQQLMRNKDNLSEKYRDSLSKGDSFKLVGIKNIPVLEDPQLAMQFENIEKSLIQSLSTNKPKNENNPLQQLLNPEKLLEPSDNDKFDSFEQFGGDF